MTPNEHRHGLALPRWRCLPPPSLLRLDRKMNALSSSSSYSEVNEFAAWEGTYKSPVICVDAIATALLVNRKSQYPFHRFPLEAPDWLRSSTPLYIIMKYHHRRCKKTELHDTGSTPRKILRDSHSICKPSTVGPIMQARKPVIIYIRPPKVIHADPKDFMAVVQRLTGSSPSGKSTVKREAKTEVPHPSSHAQSQSMMNLCFYENVNNISPLVLADVDEVGMGADNMFQLELEDLCDTGAHFQPFISSSPQHLDGTITGLSMYSSTSIQVFNVLQNVM